MCALQQRVRIRTRSRALNASPVQLVVHADFGETWGASRRGGIAHLSGSSPHFHTDVLDRYLGAPARNRSWPLISPAAGQVGTHPL